MNYTIIAPGKLILLGEYAVLEGAHTLVAAVDKYAIIHIMPSRDKHYHVCSENLNIPDVEFHFDEHDTLVFDKFIGNGYPEKLSFVKEICQSAYRYLKSADKRLVPFDCNLNTSQFYIQNNGSKLGLGSSAALSVALFVAICKFSGFIEIGLNLFSKILSAYLRAQGSLGSGVDIAASLVGGILDYQIITQAAQPEYVWDKLELNTSLRFFPIWSGLSASTPEFLKHLVEYKNNFPRNYNEIMKHLVRLANKGCMAYRQNDGEQFLETVSEYFSQLKRLSINSGIPIISDVHDRIAKIVMEAGGAYKPSGAGGGDLGLAFYHSDLTAFKIKKSIVKSGFSVVNLAINPHGVTVESRINY